jgi:WS/DGAT/MGAT family acyltransferase
MRQREPLSIIDHAWLRLDRPTNLMMICGVMLFSERLALSRVRQTIGTRLLCFHRFRQRIVQDDASAYWETDPTFDIDWHVRRIALPGAAGPAELQEITGDLISTPLDPSKPMWQFHVIDTAGRGSALVLRIHHCYGDGFALAHVIASLTDADADASAAPARDPDAAAGAASHSSWQRMLGPLTVALADAARTACALMTTLTATAGGWIAHPSRAADLARTGLNLAADLAGELAFIANMAPDSATSLKGPLGVMKRVAWAEALSLFEVQAVAEAHACSVNDVLLSCAAGALRSHLHAQGEEVDALELRAMVPVNLRPPGPITELGNRFGLLMPTLPMAGADPIERLLQVHRRMQALKQSRQAMATLAILAGIGLAPDAIREQAVATLAANASAVITNVRGAPQERHFAGRRIARQLFWVPQSGGIGVGISLLSYAGQVHVGIVTDAKLVPDPAQLAGRFRDEFEALLLSTLMMRREG